ncbi:MAG TPA: helix-turn-helix transcriptional regulator [Patescibacteria group bacterium]|nr:helix-turn-helix transcriptional regulator [Patescibacteria group bacterium]
MLNVSEGQKIQLRRKELRMSVEELAEKINLSVSLIKKIESGTKKLTNKNADIFAKALDVPITFLTSDSYQENIEDINEVMQNLNKEEIDWIKDQENKPYIIFAKMLDEKDLSDDEILLIAKSIREKVKKEKEIKGSN